jgi:hypothetical protein
VLSQLSYTPTVGVTSILKDFPRFENPFLRFSILWSEARFETVLVCSSCKLSVRNENLVSAPDRFAQKKPYSMFELRSFPCAELSQKVSLAPSSTVRLPPMVPVMWPKPTASLAFPFG